MVVFVFKLKGPYSVPSSDFSSDKEAYHGFELYFRGGLLHLSSQSLVWCLGVWGGEYYKTWKLHLMA